MILDKLKSLQPEWIEAGGLILTLMVGAILSAGVTFYKVDVMSDDVKEIKASVAAIPVLVNRVDTLEGDIEKLEKEVDIIEQRIYDMKGEINAEKGTD